MKRYFVNYTSDAEADLVAIYTYISEHLENQPAAVRIIRQIISSCDSLEVFPNGYPIRVTSHGLKLRFAHSGKYTIAYSVDDNSATVTIHAIKYSRMNLDALFQ